MIQYKDYFSRRELFYLGIDSEKEIEALSKKYNGDKRNDDIDLEMKSMYRFIKASQEKLLLKGLEVEQETRRFDEASKQTVLMRKKTDAVDYKYYTEANIMPIKLSDAFINKAINLVPELPDARFNRFVSELNLSEYDARQLINQKAVADYYEESTDVILGRKPF